MAWTIYIWYLLLLDSIIANIIALSAFKWYKKKFPRMSKALPLTKSWALWYLVLVLFIGYLVLF